VWIVAAASALFRQHQKSKVQKVLTHPTATDRSGHKRALPLEAALLLLKSPAADVLIVLVCCHIGGVTDKQHCTHAGTQEPLANGPIKYRSRTH
jgi:hypothetical protein